MSNEVVEKPASEVSTQVASNSLGLTAEDVMIPKVLLMQALSQLVSDDKAKAGEFVHSLDENVLGKEVEFYVIGLFKTLLTFENDEYIKTEPLTPQNTGLPYEEVMPNGVNVNRRKSLNYYVILKKDIEEMEAFPHVISFKGTSHKTGKKLGTQLMMLEEFGAETYAKSFKLSSKKEKNDKGTFFVMDIAKGVKTSDSEQEICKRWADRLGSMSVQVHDDAEEVDKPATAEAGGGADIPY